MKRYLFWLAVVLAGCVSTRQHPLPQKTHLLRDRLVINSDVELDRQEPLLNEVAALRATMAKQLGLPDSDEPIYVYLFAKPKEFASYSKQRYPQLTGRRAYFVKDGGGLSVFAQWNERVAEDLRHEVAHGYVHSATPQLPLWLDEGLAEYYEVPFGGAGINWPHVDRLAAARRESRWQPNLPRLEQLVDPAEMRQLDYAEAWLWVHYCLNTHPDRSAALRDYLRDLREAAVAAPFSERLGAGAPELIKHLRFLSGSEAS